jgi:hypothetical protein
LFKISYYFCFVLILPAFFSCDRKSDDEKRGPEINREFAWRDHIQLTDIPDFPVKGFIEGKEVNFEYINFERWRGSKDNVINFSMVKPPQQCGFIEGFKGFVLINKGNRIDEGKLLKSAFDGDKGTYQANFNTGDKKSSSSWNCALNIESISEKSVTGKIALFFNDESKSWVAGKFEAVICNN